MGTVPPLWKVNKTRNTWFKVRRVFSSSWVSMIMVILRVSYASEYRYKPSEPLTSVLCGSPSCQRTLGTSGLRLDPGAFLITVIRRTRHTEPKVGLRVGSTEDIGPSCCTQTNNSQTK